MTASLESIPSAAACAAWRSCDQQKISTFGALKASFQHSDAHGLSKAPQIFVDRPDLAMKIHFFRSNLGVQRLCVSCHPLPSPFKSLKMRIQQCTQPEIWGPRVPELSPNLAACDGPPRTRPHLPGQPWGTTWKVHIWLAVKVPHQLDPENINKVMMGNVMGNEVRYTMVHPNTPNKKSSEKPASRVVHPISYTKNGDGMAGL